MSEEELKAEALYWVSVLWPEHGDRCACVDCWPRIVALEGVYDQGGYRAEAIREWSEYMRDE
jgi:hypothetical protein